MNRDLHNVMMAQYAAKTASGEGLAVWSGGVRCVLPSVKLYGAVMQDGTPALDAPVMPVCNDGVFQATGPDGTWDGGQAAAPELWAIPDTEYIDEWDTQTGRGVRRVGVAVYDGTETVGRASDNLTDVYRYTVRPPVLGASMRNAPGLCSHASRAVSVTQNSPCLLIGAANMSIHLFLPKTEFPDTAAVKAWLAEQYAAGTPVTVVYPLASPEPFYRAPARLTQPNGPGQIVQVSGSVADCFIEAAYLTHS